MIIALLTIIGILSKKYLILIIQSMKQLITTQKGSYLSHQRQQQQFKFYSFHFRIFDDNIEMQSCKPYVPPLSDTKNTEHIYEEM